jgi:hypothetical protein
MQHQSQQSEGESSSGGEVIGSGTAVGVACSENGQDSGRDTYPTTKASSTKTSFTNPYAENFSFRKPAYNSQPRQSYYRNNNNPSNYSARSRNKGSGWQSGGYGSHQPSYQPWTSSKLEDVEELTANYTEEEEFSVEEAEGYWPQSTSTQQIDPVVTLERICNWLGSILRKPDLARKLAGARLELGKDEKGENKATFWLGNEDIDPRSFSREDKSLIRMAFSTKVGPRYKLQLGNGKLVVPIE